jgi:hypothetical protein
MCSGHQSWLSAPVMSLACAAWVTAPRLESISLGGAPSQLHLATACMVFRGKDAGHDKVRCASSVVLCCAFLPHGQAQADRPEMMTVAAVGLMSSTAQYNVACIFCLNAGMTAKGICSTRTFHVLLLDARTDSCVSPHSRGRGPKANLTTLH